MRLEGKHGWFKNLDIRNFKNLPLPLSNKHQLYMCNKMIDIGGDYSTNYVYTGDEIREGFMTSITSFNANIHETLCRHFGYREIFNLYETNRVNTHGIEYKNNCVLLISTDDLNMPSFGSLQNSFVDKEDKNFLLNNLRIICYLKQYHSCAVEYTENISVIPWKSLINTFPLDLYTKIAGQKLVMNKYSHTSGC